MTDERRWTIRVCPTCNAWRQAGVGWGFWCDGACSHPKVEMYEVEVVPVSSVVPISRLRELLRDVSRDFAGAHVNAGEVVGAVHRLLDGLECASNPNNERTT